MQAKKLTRRSQYFNEWLLNYFVDKLEVGSFWGLRRHRLAHVRCTVRSWLYTTRFVSSSCIDTFHDREYWTWASTFDSQ